MFKRLQESQARWRGERGPWLHKTVVGATGKQLGRLARDGWEIYSVQAAQFQGTTLGATYLLRKPNPDYRAAPVGESR